YIDSLINEYWFLTDDIKNTDIYYALEGYLFPDTYSFDDKDVSVKDIFKVMLDQMEKVLNKYKVDIQTSGHSVHDILTLASIIENEAIHDEDRKDVSSVLYNRLNARMSLGSDVTTYYAFRIEMGERDLYRSEINTYNPYNTRGPNMEGKLPVRTYIDCRASIN
ncbi:MAG: endolytic transglycosylase MltG, partial [Clostridia bacterium]|nr:endolytic transglycosylase MltG [Clostridia bacterium]